jgi:DNA-binding transcriptional ArsR family regulator
MSDAEDIARIFKVLSVGSRVRMIELLKERSLCVNALAKALEITPAAVSQHLRVLRDAEVVLPERRGYSVHYRVDREVLAEWNAVASALLGVTNEE